MSETENTIEERRETQKEKVLRLLRICPRTTMDFVMRYIMAPQKIIQLLRADGYTILTLPVKGKKESIYKLVEEPKQITLF
ncbi:MAG: hypothetical protein II453_10110 [Alphaproteobacteria bacterium]|nr:hypothetical protein [Alphaproteobacteria bacterium]MBQ3946326.1 hypothetical protein [Alphaproteobacteria bacterium]